MVSYGIALLITIFLGSCCANYCDPSLCTEGPHIACTHSAKFGVACGADGKLVTMDGTMQRLILSKHNELRAEIANGMHGFPPAVRMPTVVWDKELANISSYNARKCHLAHDQCRNTKVFKFSGQNLAITRFSGLHFKPADRAVNFTQEWFDEHKHCPKEYIDSYPASHSGPQIGHFTQMVNDRTWKVGCSMMDYKHKSWSIYYMVCNYSMTNIVDKPVYTQGKMGSKCTTGQNPKYPGLCSPEEKINSEP